MEDITPGLIESVTDEFHRLYDGSAKIKALLEKVKAGTATYAEAQEYSLEVSRLIGAAYEKHISPAVLPDGKMYYNIASRLIPATLDENHSLVAEYAAKVQKALNEKAKIGLTAQKAPLDSDRVDGLVELAAGEEYAKVEPQLLTAFDGFCQSIVDETIRRNADLHHKVGLSPKIIRRSTGKCCDWCRALVGIHPYPVEREIYQRHANCRCTVLYDPADGSKSMQNVHSKEWTNTKGSANIKIQEARTSTGKNASGYRRPGTQQVRNNQLRNGLPIVGEPGALVDKTDDFGKVLQRRVYGPDGKALIDYDTTDHGLPSAHPTGAHKHVFDYSKRNPHGSPLPLDEVELIENADIIQRGVNYHDQK